MTRSASFVHDLLRIICIREMPSSSTISTALSVSARALQVFQFIGDGACPPLKSICGVASVIIEEVQALNQLKKDNADLANRVTDIVMALCADYAAHPHNFEVDKDAKLTTLLVVLKDIHSSQMKQAAIGGWRRFWKLQELKGDLVSCNKRLDDCCRLFNLSSLVEIRELLLSGTRITQTSLCDIATGINANIDRAASTIEISQVELKRDLSDLVLRVDKVLDLRPQLDSVTMSDEGFPILRRGQVDLHRVLSTFHAGHIHRGDFLANRGVTKTIVKSYNPDNEGQKEFYRDLKFWRKQFHANLHRLLGHSSLSVSDPFILLSDYVYRDASEYMEKELAHDEVGSFMSTLLFLQGIASGLDYLRRCCSMNKTELEQCARASNLVITSEGKVIVGHNLVTNGPGRTSLELDANLDTWLLELFWWLGIRFVYGPEEPDLTNWYWISGRYDTRSYSHLRMLGSFLKYLLGSLTASARELEAVAELLKAPHRNGKLSFNDIRLAVMQVRHWDVCNIYRPSKAVEVQLLDIGFMCDGIFIALESGRELFQYDKILSPPSNTRCTGNVDAFIEDETGHIIHRFYSPQFAEVRRRTTYEKIADYETAWKFFMANVKQIHQVHSVKYPELRVSDLILVVLVETDHRYTNMEWKPEAGSLEPPTYIEFVEFPDTKIGAPWGYWKVDNGTKIPVSADATKTTQVCSGIADTGLHASNLSILVHSSRCAQNLTFLQMEDCDTL